MKHIYNNRFLVAAITAASTIVPASAENWEPVGSGFMSDFILYSIFAEAPEQTFTVDWEEDADREGVYRIAEPYAHYRNILAEQSLVYNSEDATPLVIHVEENGAVWFEPFNTGFRLGNDPIHAFCSIEEKINSLGFEESYSKWPDAFGKFEDGFVTWKTCFPNGKSSVFSIIAQFPTMIDENTGRAESSSVNLDDCFHLVFPGREDNPDLGWETLEGKAEFTDDILASFFGLDDNQTMAVTLQRRTDDETRYRLVSPYSTWESPFTNVRFNPEETRYLRFDMFEGTNGTQVYVHRMYTGIVGDGYGEIYFYSQIKPFVDMYSWSLQQLGEWYPDAFGVYDEDSREIRFANTFDYGGSPHYTFLINPTTTDFHPGNQSEAFCIKLPKAEGTQVESLTSGNVDTKTEYYTIEGIRTESPKKGQLLIRKSASGTEKIIY